MENLELYLKGSLDEERLVPYIKDLKDKVLSDLLKYRD